MAHTKNMTEGKPFPIIFAYFIPILCSTLFQQLYSIIDTIIVGKTINDMALAAVGATGAISFFIFGFIMGLGSGMSVLMAQAYGASDYNKLRKVITMGFLSCCVVSVIIMIFGIAYVRPVLVLLNTSEVLLENAVLYITIIIVGIPLTLVYNCLAGILSALGDSKTPLVAVIISSIINIILDIVFIAGFGMGVDGAAYATLIAQVCSGIFCFVKLRKISFIHLKKEDWQIDISLIVQQFKVGVPVAFMNSVTAIGCLLLQYFVNDFGENYTAAYSACSRVTGFLTQPSTAVGMALSTFAGQNYGVGKIDRIKEGLKSGLKMSLTITVIASTLLIGAPRFLASIVLSDEVNIALSIDYLRICGVMMWSISLLFLTRSTCQGMGFTIIPMISGFLELIARVGMIFWLVKPLGYNAIAISEVTAWFSALLLNGIYLLIILRRLGKKKPKEIMQSKGAMSV